MVVSIGAMSVANSLRMRWLMESDPAAGVRPSIVFTFKFVWPMQSSVCHF